MSITDRYLARVFGFYIVGLLALLVIVLQMLDLLSHSDEIMAAPGATMWSLGKYAVLHAPQFLIKFTPFAVLMAMLLSMMQLAVSSEIIALRSTGMAPVRIVKPFVLVALLVAAGHFLFAEFVAVPARAEFTAWVDNGYSSLKGGVEAQRKNIWYQLGSEMVHVDQAEWYADHMEAQGLTLYNMGPEGLFTSRIKAKSAIYRNHVWTLHDGESSRRDQIGPTQFRTMTWDTQMLPSALLHESTSADALALPALSSRINDLEAGGSAASRARTALFMRFSQPFASLIMPFLGLFVGLAVPRAGKFAAMMAFGLGVGFVFFTIDNLGIALGNLGVLPPVLATFAAPVGFLCGGVLYLISREA